MEAEASTISHNDNEVTPSFIDSSPLGVDLLEGKSQEQIADSISRLIRTNRTENRLIGLDGAWGSGKSNLVKIIESKLKNTHHIFYYDAWGHQEDLQRRSFLEELTADLCNKKIVDPKEWNQKLKDLLSRKRETLTKTTPKLSDGVLFTLFVAIFTPIAKIIADGIANQDLKILITSLPVFIGFSAWIIASIKAGHRLKLKEIYYLYSDKDLINQTDVTISEKEPSVSEFQGWMKDLSKSLGEKSLLIIFDNMDRLPPGKVRELWSSIHTFFAEDSYKDIWVIIPFDRKHIADAFEGNEEVSDQFLSKSFSVIYRVAPPVLTDWQKFFELTYKKAFGDNQNEELDTIRKVFDLLQEQITPRSVIAFINEMVSLRLVVQKDILLKYIALFVLTKKLILEKPVDQILSLDFLQQAEPLFRKDKDLRDHIAALVYHVPLASASQVSLLRGIQIALREKDNDRIKKLAKHLHFIDILEQVVDGEDLDIENSTETLAMLDDIYTEDKKAQNRITKIWDTLCSKVLMAPVSNQEFSTTHELLLAHSSKLKCSELAEHIVKGIRNAEDFSGDEYFEALAQLDNFLEENELDVDLSPMLLDITKEPEIFIDYVHAAGDEYKKYKLKCDESKLLELITKRIPNNLDELAPLSSVTKEYDFEPLIDLLEEQLTNNNLTTENIEPFYEFYKAIATNPLELINDAHIQALLQSVENDSKGQFELFAMRLARASEFPNYGGIAQTILSQTDEKLANRIAKRIEYYTTYGDLLLVFTSWNQPLLKAVLRDLTLNKYGTSKMHITKVLKHFNTLYTSLDITADDFIKKLNRWAQSAKDHITTDNVADIILDQVFFDHAIEIDNELTTHICKVMVNHLNSLSVGDWEDPLREESSHLLNVTYLLLKSGKLKNLPDNAITVYKEILIETARGEFDMSADEAWELFYQRTNKHKLKATAKDIRDLFINDTAITPYIFSKLAILLLQNADLKEKSADVVRKILAPVVSDTSCLEFIVSNKEYFIHLVKEAGDDASDFKDTVRQIAPSSNTNVIEFAKAIGIN